MSETKTRSLGPRKKLQDERETFTVIYNYFDRSGEQKERKITRSSLKALITAMKRSLANDELYYIAEVSPNLYDYDFDQHGTEFEGYASMRFDRNKAYDEHTTSDETIYEGLAIHWDELEKANEDQIRKDFALAGLDIDEYNNYEVYARGTADQWKKFFRLSTWMEGIYIDWEPNTDNLWEELVAMGIIYPADEFDIEGR